MKTLQVTDAMIRAVLPWLRSYHMMRQTDKESAVREALKYAIEIYEVERARNQPK